MNPAMRNQFGLLLVIISVILLFPGLTQPMLTLKVTAMGMTLFEKSQSIIETAETLYQNGSAFTAFLILLFSILIPFLKAILIGMCFALKNLEFRNKLYAFIIRIGKWSMADVFVVGIFVAFLAGKGTAQIDATILPGFYYFTGYCLISVLAFEFLRMEGSSILRPSKDSGKDEPTLSLVTNENEN